MSLQEQTQEDSNTPPRAMEAAKFYVDGEEDERDGGGAAAIISSSVSSQRAGAAALPDIGDFYAGRSVFITGATGFLGKVLVEKLLRSCPQVRCLYLLIRPKGERSAADRLEEMLSCKIFDYVKSAAWPGNAGGAGGEGDVRGVRGKLVAVHGDMLTEGLGITDHVRTQLCQNVSLVFHSAATIKFDEKLRLSVEMNVIGVRRLVSFCSQMKHLQALVHVSTAYANCNRDQVSEAMYPPPMDDHKLLDAMEWMSDEMVDAITPHIIGDRPNTYTFTKAMAEHVLVREAASHFTSSTSASPTCSPHGGVSVAIVRPSIVVAAWREPIPGWIDNYNGPTGLLAAVGKGLLRTMKGEFNATADIIPVDIPVNLMIAVGWYTALHRPREIIVYNSTSGSDNRVTWGQVERASFDSWMKNPADSVFRIPNPRFTSSSVWYEMKVLFDHMLPAALIDYCRRCVGQKSNLRRVYKSIHRAANTLDYFTTNQWHFTQNNTHSLLFALSERDRQTFNFDVAGLDWSDYLEKYCLGTKRFVLGEDLAGLPAARRHLRLLQHLTTALQLTACVIIWRLLIARSNLARKLWYLVITLSVRLVKSMPWMTRS